MTTRIIRGDCLEELRKLPDELVHCCVTSPPYWGLRDYGVAGQLGLESTPQEYVEKMVAVFSEVRRVLRDDGTCWINLGDSYAGSNMTGGTNSKEHGRREDRMIPGRNTGAVPLGLKSKDLCGIPWRVAFALQADGWYLRQDIIWAKPNPMPESVRDRCTKSHEYLFLLAKSERYYCDMDAIAEPLTRPDELDRATPAVFGGRDKWPEAQKQSRLHSGNEYKRKVRKPAGWDTGEGGHGTIHRDGRAQEVEYTETDGTTRNKRDVWTIATQSFKEAHFATFPPALIEPCILAGCPVGGAVLDPFGGAGTTGLVADRLQRSAILIELNPEYASMAEKRITGDCPMFAQVA